ncbi:MAG: cyclic nucleotide-binding protein [Sulfurovum sp. FS06-10]|nr:MAG: cyclic nucleotide-binding protein [Sulfurovum sp. FS06-10]
MQHYGIEIFKEFDQRFEQEFFKYAKVVSFKKKETPFVNDRLLSYFYIVLMGKIKSYQIGLENGKEQTLFVYRTGDMFDTLVLLDNKPHDVLYEVLESTNVLEIPLKKVRQWMVENETFRQHIFTYIASQMRYTETLASDLSLLNTAERLSKLLLQNMNPTDKHHYQLLDNLSKTEIAKLLGTVRHVVERHLKELEEENIIENNRKNIYIKDIKKLLANAKPFILN